MEKLIVITCHIINLIISIITVITFVYSRKMREKNISKLPRNIRIYLLFCCFPYSVIISFLSITSTICYFASVSHVCQSITYILLAFAFQQFRFSLLLLATERVVATVVLEKYGKYSCRNSLFVAMFVLTYCLAVFYVILTIYDTLTMKKLLIFDYDVYYVVFLHAITLIMCKAVHLANNRLYKLLAYRITLKKRQQIVENVKVIKFLWPTIFIFAIFAPIGPLLALIYKIYLNKNAAPVLTQLSYNFSFLLMMAYRIYKSLKKQRPEVVEEKPMTVVKSPFGKEIPTNVEMEIYFKQLNEQWK